MRNRMWFIRSLAVCVTFIVVLSADIQASQIEAVRGKKYRITKQHGPWMIMVASVSEPPKERRAEGMSPDEAADELVYELRRLGIPAYTYSQSDKVDHIRTQDRLGRSQERVYRAQHGGICIIAGNYPSIDDTKAQKTLKFIKGYHPKCWADQGIYRKTPGRPGPLSHAFLMVNPYLSQEEVAQRERDPLILKLNSGREYSLLANKGKYTVVVASFFGKSVTGVGASQFAEVKKDFQVGNGLDEAAMDAWQLAKVLREKQHQEAYVFHDRHRSLVTIGSFNSPNDPGIAAIQRRFGGKVVQHPQTGQNVLTAEFVVIPGRSPSDPPEKRFIMNTKPYLMPVPTVQR